MKSGIVPFKRCDNAYDCNACPFDKAMALAIQGQAKKSGPKPSFREKAKEASYMERQCRHMLTGRVAVRKCGNDFRCDTCEFDQALEDNPAADALGTVPIVEVFGYRYSDSYYYHAGHSWARVEYGGRVRIGMDDFAMKLLGSPDTLSLPRPGQRIARGEAGMALRRDSHEARVLLPLEGTVLAVNHQALDRPAVMHADPYQRGWRFLIEPTRLKKDLEQLFFGATGQEWLGRECQKLHELVLGDYGSMAATGAAPVDDLFGMHPEIGWETLVQTFLRTGR